jgi:hypothetical protein
MAGPIPVQAARLIRALITLILVRVPLNALATGLTLYLTARFAGRALGDTGMAQAGSTTLTVLLTTMGVAIGCMAGLLAAFQGVLRLVEEELQNWLLQLSSEDGERVFPEIELARLRSGYEDVTRSMYDGTIGRLPVPGLIRRKLFDQLSQTILAEFLADCEQRGATSVGFTELRDGLLLRAVPLVTRPAHTQLRAAHLLLAAVLLGCVTVPLLAAILA